MSGSFPISSPLFAIQLVLHTFRVGGGGEDERESRPGQQVHTPGFIPLLGTRTPWVCPSLPKTLEVAVTA